MGTCQTDAPVSAMGRSQSKIAAMLQAAILDLMLILVALPLVATVGGWLFARRQDLPSHDNQTSSQT